MTGYRTIITRMTPVPRQSIFTDDFIIIPVYHMVDYLIIIIIIIINNDAIYGI